MKHYLALVTLFITTTAIAMEENQKLTGEAHRISNNKSNQYITIFNLLPHNDSNLPDTRIEISDLKRSDNTSYKSDNSTFTLYSREKVRFEPGIYKDMPKNYRLGMNDAEDDALIQLYVHAAIKHKLILLRIGKDRTIKFGDSLYFKHHNYLENIVLEHKNKIVCDFPLTE